jgi:hypothetical protein
MAKIGRSNLDYAALSMTRMELGSGGPRQMVCLQIDRVNFWLVTIEPRRMYTKKPTARCARLGQPGLSSSNSFSSQDPGFGKHAHAAVHISGGRPEVVPPRRDMRALPCLSSSASA